MGSVQDTFSRLFQYPSADHTQSGYADGWTLSTAGTAGCSDVKALLMQLKQTVQVFLSFLILFIQINIINQCHNNFCLYY